MNLTYCGKDPVLLRLIMSHEVTRMRFLAKTNHATSVRLSLTSSFSTLGAAMRYNNATSHVNDETREYERSEAKWRAKPWHGLGSCTQEAAESPLRAASRLASTTQDGKDVVTT